MFIVGAGIKNIYAIITMYNGFLKMENTIFVI